MLKQNEIARYARHLSLEQVGMEGQQRLKSSKVLVVGAGGLGTPIIQYLTAAGVGTIGIIDHDVVTESNLQRQVIYTTQDLGKRKVDVAAERMQALNPNVSFEAYPQALSSENALDILSRYDIVLDGTDNFATRYLINDACIILDLPFVHGSIFKFQGQLAVFNYKKGPSYRCLFPQPPSALEAPNCSEVGVLGVLPGVIGTHMATECLKIILEVGSVQSGTVTMIDLLQNQTRQIQVPRNADNFTITELQKNYASVCDNETKKSTMTVHELKQKLDANEKLVLLDVRETHELSICAFEAAVHIPLNDIPKRLDELPKDQPIVTVCHHGIRSAHALNFLSKNGFSELQNLEGGIHAWAVFIDPDMKQY